MPFLQTRRVPKPSILAALLFTSAATLGGCVPTTTAQSASESAATTAAEPVVIEMKRGEVLQVIAPENAPDGAAAQRAYFAAAGPLSSALGFKQRGFLEVQQKVVSDFDPSSFIFYSWPNEAALAEFSANPDWAPIKATRPDAWKELKVYSSVLEDDLTLSFDPAKHYTLVVGWANPENPGDYERYLSGIEPAVARSGGRFIYKMETPTFEAHASSPEAPVQLTFVEWESREGFTAVQASPEYAANNQYFASGLSRFEFYWLAPRS